jgi:two-component system, chemotaxis family, protein-glutamate methylesterase/glutaminase
VRACEFSRCSVTQRCAANFNSNGAAMARRSAGCTPREANRSWNVDGVRRVVEAASHVLRLPIVAIVRSDQPGFTAVRPFEWGAVALVPREVSSNGDLASKIEASLDRVRNAQVVDLLEGHFPLSGAFPDAAVFDMRRSLQDLEPGAKVVVIGAGLGGPMAVRRILGQLQSVVVSPVVYAQRIPESLAGSLAQWLEHHTGASVQRAASGPLEVGQVYLVPSGFEAHIVRQNEQATLEVAPSEAATTPCFDTLLESVATAYAQRTVAALLSGRGSDGAQGLLAVRRAGGFTMVQDRVSSLVYDTPGQARDGGGAIECLPINEIAERIQMLMRPEPASWS